MLKIGEFSRLTRVSVRMLHYYDDIGLLKPVQTDKFTGYRLYSVSQVAALQKNRYAAGYEFPDSRNQEGSQILVG